MERTRRELEFALETGPGKEITPERLHAFLDRFQGLLADVTNAVGQTYFGYVAEKSKALGNAR